jgi:prophage regulatory protein
MSECVLRLPQVKQKIGKSRSAIYHDISQGTFPKPIRLGARSVGWLESEVEAWIQSKRANDGGPTDTAHVRNPAQINRPLQGTPFGRFGRVLR